MACDPDARAYLPGKLPVLACAVAGLFAALTVALPGLGERRVHPISLGYNGGPGCPDRATLLQRIRSRVPVEEVPSRPDLRGFEVTLVPAPLRTKGTLVVREADGTETRRNVSAGDCDEAADALALIVALTLDPEAASRPPQDASCASAVGACAAPAASALASASASAVVPMLPPEELAPRFRVGGGARGTVSSAIAPDPASGGALTLQVRYEGEGLWLPALHTSFALIPLQSFPAGSGKVALDWMAGSALFCPLALRGEGLELAPCLGLEFGQLHAMGREVPNPREASSLWFAGMAALEGAWTLAGPLRLELSVGLAVPPARHVYTIGENQVYATAPIGLRGALGVGLLW